MVAVRAELGQTSRPCKKSDASPVKRRCEQPKTRSTAQKCPSGETRTGCATLSDDVIAHCSELVFTPPEPAHGLPFAYGTYTTRSVAHPTHPQHATLREGVDYILRFYYSEISASQPVSPVAFDAGMNAWRPLVRFSAVPVFFRLFSTPAHPY